MWHASCILHEGDHLNSLSVVMLNWWAFVGRSVYRLKVLIDNKKEFEAVIFLILYLVG